MSEQPRFIRSTPKAEALDAIRQAREQLERPFTPATASMLRGLFVHIEGCVENIQELKRARKGAAS
jgi:hypothetical protein